MPSRVRSTNLQRCAQYAVFEAIFVEDSKLANYAVRALVNEILSEVISYLDTSFYSTCQIFNDAQIVASEMAPAQVVKRSQERNYEQRRKP